MAEKTTRIARNRIHKGVIFDYYQDQIIGPNKSRLTYDFISHQGAAAVLPITADGKLLMVRQYRNALDRFTWEIPAGGLEGPNEPTLDAAKRELREETGYCAENWRKLLSVRTSVAFCNEKIDVYLATGLLREGEQHLDAEESIDVRLFALEDLVEMILSGEIEDSKTIGAVMTYKALLQDGKV